MQEIFQLCDTVTVLRDGRHISTEPISETSHARVIQQMIGREVITARWRHVENPLGAEALRVEGLRSPGRFGPVSFSLRAGEVVGVAGLIGAGRSELAEAIFGLDPAVEGEVRLKGKPLPPGDVRAA